jgi:hypothetical protein
MGADATTRADSLKTSLKQLGIWLNMNKQKNVEAVQTAGQPVAVKAGLMDLLVGFATQYGLSLLPGGGTGPLAGTELSGSVSKWFGDMGSFIDTNISGAFGSVYESVTGIFDITTTTTLIDGIKVTSDSVVAPLTSRGIGAQFTDFIQPKIDAIASWSRDLYKMDLIPGEANYSLEQAFNTIDSGFSVVTKALQLPELKLTDTISAAANTTVQSSINAKMSDLLAVAANPLATNLEVQAVMDEVQTDTDTLYAEVVSNQTAMADASATKLLLEETGNVYDNLLRGRTRIAEATVEGDFDTVASVEQWIAVYRAGLNPALLQLVDDLIVINDEDAAGPAIIEPTVMAKPADNPNQLVGQLTT